MKHKITNAMKKSKAIIATAIISYFRYVIAQHLLFRF